MPVSTSEELPQILRISCSRENSVSGFCINTKVNSVSFEVNKIELTGVDKVRLSLSKVKSPYCNLDDNWILAGRLVNARKVGDTIELGTENGTKVSVQIIGIFMSAGNAEKDQPSKTTAVNRIENQVFIDNSTYKELFKEAEFEKLCVYSKRPEKLDVLETSLQKIFGNDVELSTSDTLYQQMSAPLEQISKVANLMLVLTLVTGTVVVSLLLCMWMRTRQKEVAIFMSLGKTKSEIFLQTLLEAGSVFTLSVLGATAIGKLFSGVLQNVITGSETVTENLKVVLQIQDIGMLFLLGGAVILVALCCSILPILRANPKDILAKMEG